MTTREAKPRHVLLPCPQTDNAPNASFPGKGVRQDNGGEYVPYSHESNGVAERINRTIMSEMRAMLSDSTLPRTDNARPIVHQYGQHRRNLSGAVTFPFFLKSRFWGLMALLDPQPFWSAFSCLFSCICAATACSVGGCWQPFGHLVLALGLGIAPVYI